MLEIGLIIISMDMAFIFLFMVSMKDIGNMVKDMVLEFILLTKEKYMMAIGRMILKMVRGYLKI